jgi:hypothetical protein
MADDKQISDWRKHWRQSIQALPVAVGCLAALCGILFVVNLFVSVPMWLATLLVGIAAFSVVGDAINIVYLGRKLQRAKRDEGAGRLPNVF